MLDRPDGAGAAGAALHLVVDVEDPVAVAELAQARREVGRHGNEATLALDRLEDDARDALGVDLGLEEPLERVDRVVGADAAVRVGRGGAVDLRRERAEAALVDDLARHRHGQQRPAVEGVLEDDDGGPAGRGARDLDGVLDPLGARVDEQALLLGAAARRELGQPAADLDVGLVRADHEALVQVAVDLLVDRGDDRLEAVPRVLAGDPAREVEERPPVGIGDVRAFGARHDETRGRHAARDVPPARLGDSFARALLYLCHG